MQQFFMININSVAVVQTNSQQSQRVIASQVTPKSQPSLKDKSSEIFLRVARSHFHDVKH